MKKTGKRIAALTMALAVAFSLLCGNAWAAETGKCGKNVNWTLNDEGTLTISGKGTIENNGTDDQWYPYWEQIRKIVVKKGVTAIGVGAFSCWQEDFPNLRACTVSLPEGLTKIEEYAFSGTPITSVSIPASVRIIGDGAFSSGDEDRICLKKATFRSGSKLKDVGQEAFSCTDLKEIRFPPSLDGVGNWFADADRIYFSGNAPRNSEEYTRLMAPSTIYYPAGNKTWASPRKLWNSADGKLTWKAWNPYRTELTKVKAGKKKAAVKWKKNPKVTGYQVQYAANKKFKKAKIKTVKGAKKTSVTLKKLKGKKKYYFRVRTYKVDAKKKYYSAWSKAKAVTVKK